MYRLAVLVALLALMPFGAGAQELSVQPQLQQAAEVLYCDVQQGEPTNVMLYVGAEWCPPCRKAKATVMVEGSGYPELRAAGVDCVAVFDMETGNAEEMRLIKARFPKRSVPQVVLLSFDRADDEKPASPKDMRVLGGITAGQALTSEQLALLTYGGKAGYAGSISPKKRDAEGYQTFFTEATAGSFKEYEAPKVWEIETAEELMAVIMELLRNWEHEQAEEYYNVLRLMETSSDLDTNYHIAGFLLAVEAEHEELAAYHANWLVANEAPYGEMGSYWVADVLAAVEPDVRAAGVKRYIKSTERSIEEQMDLYEELADALAAKDNYNAARNYYARALGLFDQAVPTDHPDRELKRAKLMLKHNPDEGLRLLSGLTQQHPYLAPLTAAMYCRRAERWSEAIYYGRFALQGGQGYQRVQAARMVAGAHAALGEYKAAIAVIEQAQQEVDAALEALKTLESEESTKAPLWIEGAKDSLEEKRQKYLMLAQQGEQKGT